MCTLISFLLPRLCLFSSDMAQSQTEVEHMFTWPMTLQYPIMSSLGRHIFMMIGGQVDTGK